MNGILIINKPKEYTSHDIVAVIRKTLGIKQVGHTGTLDPNATGVLPILIGQATKISKYLIEHDKTYLATIQLGEKKDTGDIEGKTIEKKIVSDILEIEIEKVLKSFIGKTMQTPPMYSAIKVNGKKLYEYAREGKTVKIEPREIEIYNINLTSLDKKNKKITFEVSCSKGTYIRTLCEDIAKKLDTVGYMCELERTRINDFDISQAIKLEKLNKETVKEKLLSIEEVFSDKNLIELNNKELILFLNGVKLKKILQNDIYRIYNNNEFIGLGIIENNLLKRDIII